VHCSLPELKSGNLVSKVGTGTDCKWMTTGELDNSLCVLRFQKVPQASHVCAWDGPCVLYLCPTKSDISIIFFMKTKDFHTFCMQCSDKEQRYNDEKYN
jgi:hypothetical protein